MMMMMMMMTVADADLPAVVRGSFIKTQIRYSRVSVALSPLSVAGAVNHGYYDIREATHHCLTNYHSFHNCTHMLAVWCSGNALVSVNAVALHRARLVLGWVTAFEQVNCLIT